MTRKEYQLLYCDILKFSKRELDESTLNYLQRFEDDTIELFHTLDEVEASEIAQELKALADLLSQDKIFITIYIYSVLLQLKKDISFLEDLLQHILNSKGLDGYQEFYLWNQLKRLLFTIPELGIKTTREGMQTFYEKIYLEFRHVFQNMLTPIPLELRKEEIIVVFATQILSDRHAPTHTALERCYTLQKDFNKTIYLINTKEQLTKLGMIPFSNQSLGNSLDHMDHIRQIEYKDTKFFYYQAQGDMPSVEETLRILQLVLSLKPYLIFNIGGGSIVSDLCSNLIPTAAIATVFSDLPMTKGQFCIIGKKLTQHERKALEVTNQLEGVIESTFSFELKPQQHHFERKEFGIPEDCFACAIVGTRLDSDINGAFIERLQETFVWNTHMVFAGYFEDYSTYCDQYPSFAAHSTYVGYCEDILALMELCDIYINPPRIGGGFSVVEAMYQKKPAVTLNYGDVAAAAGEDFCVDDMEELLKTVERYRFDQQFYDQQSMKAYHRALVVTNAYQPMKDIISQIETSIRFF